MAKSKKRRSSGRGGHAYSRGLPYNLGRFARRPESMLESAYLMLTERMDDKHRVRLSLVVSYLRGVYDLLRFVETELECTRLAMDHIEARMAELKDENIEPSDLPALADDITDWIDATYKWRSDKRFGVKTRNIAEFDDDWTKKIASHTDAPKLELKHMTKHEIRKHLEVDR